MKLPNRDLPPDSLAAWPNGVPRISDETRQSNLESPEALRGLIATLWLYIGLRAETKLTTEQKELLADVVEASDPDPFSYDRWWQR